MQNNEIYQVELVTTGRVYDKTERFMNIYLIVCAIIAFFTLTIGMPAIMSAEQEEYEKEHAYGEYQCPHCGSMDTMGFYTFSYNNGMLCNGSKEYNLQHADYSLFGCDYCGKDFKVYRSQWENKSK